MKFFHVYNQSDDLNTFPFYTSGSLSGYMRLTGTEINMNKKHVSTNVPLKCYKEALSHAKRFCDFRHS